MFRTTRWILTCLFVATAIGLAGCDGFDSLTNKKRVSAAKSQSGVIDISALKAGDMLEVSESGSWWEGVIVQIVDEKAKVSYVGWDDSWNEWVGVERLRPMTGDGVGHGGPIQSDSRGFFANLRNGGDASPPLGVQTPVARSAARSPRPSPPAQSGGDIDVNTLRPGEALEVSETGSWWACTVIQVSDGHAKIHYVGWDDGWNEWVTSERLRRSTGSANTQGGAIDADPRGHFSNKRNGDLSGPYGVPRAPAPVAVAPKPLPPVAMAPVAPATPVAPAPPAPPASLPELPDGTIDVNSLKPGDGLEVSESGSWWGCTVVQVADGQAKIRYVGWDESWNEWVSSERLRASTGKGNGGKGSIAPDPRGSYPNKRNGNLPSPPAPGGFRRSV